MFQVYDLGVINSEHVWLEPQQTEQVTEREGIQNHRESRSHPSPRKQWKEPNLIQSGTLGEKEHQLPPATHHSGAHRPGQVLTKLPIIPIPRWIQKRGTENKGRRNPPSTKESKRKTH
ncbi:hypothetical protein O181_112650 [Austropuccinia psidii MF-1]|uniref:Uncharacterized protein n=1 Tax=Austropuccinia psidii MF-1 TaxID=1389203 RepID=A0A9Q3K4U9_9BASI|nr:hypothetical protein [Austropuccinia psidii MF-1]